MFAGGAPQRPSLPALPTSAKAGRPGTPASFPVRKEVSDATRSNQALCARRRAVVLVCLCAAPDALGQTTRATLTGTVTDPNGAVVPGATVNATNVATNISNATKTNQDGTYTFTALPPGEYTVAVELTGFKRSLQTGIILQIAETSRLDIPLEVGAVNEEVSVVSQAPLVRSTSSEQGQVIDYKQIQSLPLNGRLFQQLITLTPGAIPAGFADFAENPAGAGARSAVHHSVNGLPWSGNNYLLDGVANNEPLNAFVNITPPLEALQEFKVQTNNPTAEFGVFGGAVVNLSIRSGTNQFSGSVFEYYRDESLNARNFFAATKAPFNSHQFGGTFGGPMLRNKAFFFGDYQRLRQDQGRTVIATVPTAEMRRGDLSAFSTPIFDPLSGQPFAGNIIPGAAHQPDHAAGRRHLAAAEPGRPGRQLHREQRGRAGAGRVRHPRRREPGRDGGRSSAVTPEPIATSSSRPPPTSSWLAATGPSRAITTSCWDTRSRCHRAGSTSSGSASTSTTSRSSAPTSGSRRTTSSASPTATSRVTRTRSASPTSTSPATCAPPLPASRTRCGLARRCSSRTTSRGCFDKHSVKFGGDVRFIQSTLTNPQTQPRGLFTFDRNYTSNLGAANTGQPWASFLLGFPNRVQRDFVDTYPEVLINFVGFFVQDDFRVTRNLTLNLGLRWDLLTTPVEKSNRQTNFSLQDGLIHVASDDDRGPLTTNFYGGWAPRLGVAYSPDDGRTAIRGAYGISYYRDNFGANGGTLERNHPLFQQVDLQTQNQFTPFRSVSDGLPGFTPVPLTPTIAPPPGFAVFFFPAGDKPNMAHMFNVGRSAPAPLVVRARRVVRGNTRQEHLRQPQHQRAAAWSRQSRPAAAVLLGWRRTSRSSISARAMRNPGTTRCR